MKEGKNSLTLVLHVERGQNFFHVLGATKKLTAGHYQKKAPSFKKMIAPFKKYLLSTSELLFDSCELDSELDDEDGHSASVTKNNHLRYHIIDLPGVLGNNVLGSKNCSYDLIRCIEQS